MLFVLFTNVVCIITNIVYIINNLDHVTAFCCDYAIIVRFSHYYYKSYQLFIISFTQLFIVSLQINN